MKRQISVKDLLRCLGGEARILGSQDNTINKVAPLSNADSESVTFCTKQGEDGLCLVRKSNAGVVICHQDLPVTPDDVKEKTIILVANPRLAFGQVFREYFQIEMSHGMSVTIVIEKDAEIHSDVYIGNRCYVGKCKIGRNTIIYGNTHIYPNVVIGKNVIIHAGVVIGAEGSGFERNERGELEKFPQIGGVIIEDDVEIGSNSCIMRAAMGNTIIGKGTKLGNLCNIGHGAVIGKQCLILTQSTISGSVCIGDYSQISMGARIRNKIKIGRNVLVGMGAVVARDVADDEIVFGVPAKKHGKAG